MPDSFTKFKEEPPKKTSSSGGSSSGGSTDPDEGEPEVSDVVYSIASFDVFQSTNDTLFFSVSDSDGFRVGDSINVSSVAIGPGVNDVGLVTSISSVPEGDDFIAVSLSGTGIVGPNTYIEKDYFIDSCATGYSSCAVGSVGAAVITSVVSFYVSPEAPAIVGTRNFQKSFTITGTSEFGFSTVNLAFDYSLSPATPLGFGFTNTANVIQTDDELVSPYGPFTSVATMAFGESNPLVLTASVASAQFGDALDPEETATTNIYVASTIPGEVTEASDSFNLTYFFNNGDRFAVRAASVTGFTVGDTVRSCRFSVAASCDQDTDQINGKATIDFIDTSTKVMFLTAASFDHDANGATPVRLSDFPENNFITNGSFVVLQDSENSRLFRNTTTGVSILPNWNIQNDLTDDPTSVTYQIDQSFPGMSFNTTTGEITVNSPDVVTNLITTITALNASTGEVIDTFVTSFSAFGTPTNLAWDDGVGAASTTLSSPINVPSGVEFNFSASTGVYPLSADASASGYNRVYYTVTGDPDGAPFALPAGATIANPSGAGLSAELRFTPSAYLDGTGVYTISGFHPAYSATTPFASATISFKSATNFDKIVYPQLAGDSLILTVNDSSSFTAATGANFVSTSSGARGTIQFVDNSTNKLFVTVTSNLSGNTVFKQGDIADITSSFVVQRATITDVVHVFDITDANNRFNGPNGLVPAFFDTAGNAIAIDPLVETLSWAVSPGLTSDMTFDTTDGSITANTANDIAILAKTTYQIFVTPEVGPTRQTNYSVVFKESPSNASVARFQFLRLDGNGNRFYRGSRISTAGNDVQGRVLMTVDLDGNGVTDGLLLENNGDIDDGTGIDNTATFFASEAFVEPYQFWYVKDDTGFATTNVVSSSGGATARIEAIDTANNRFYVKVLSGSFSNGTTISFGGTNTVINTVEDRHYVTGVIQVNSLAALNQFTIGGEISSDTLGNNTDDSLGIVVQKHIENNDTLLTTADDRHYLLIQHISGEFREGDQVDNAGTFAASVGTISRIVGPNINLYTPGVAVGPTAGLASSSNKVDASLNPFFEGSLIGNFVSADQSYQSVGYSVAGTDFGSGKVVVNVEDYFSHFFRDNGVNSTYIDDFTESTVAGVNNQSHNKLENVELSNLVIAYVEDKFHLEPFVKGEFSSVSISPDTLPGGLSFNTTTGVLSGTPTEPANLNDFVMTFVSSDGLSTTSYAFPMVVYNQFEVAQLTENASSHLLHKEGQGLGAARCRVFGPQVIDDVNDPNYNQAIYGLNDVVCRLEAGENDLYASGVDFSIKSGAGMCEFVRYTPFSYLAFAQGNTSKIITTYASFDATLCASTDAGFCTVTEGNAFALDYVTAASINAGSALILTEDGPDADGVADNAARTFGFTYCEDGSLTCIRNARATSACNYDYSTTNSIDTSVSFPNVDEGSYIQRNVSCSFEGIEDVDENGVPDNGRVSCTVTESAAPIQCAGSAPTALGGAKRSTDLEDNESAVVVSSFGGLSDQRFTVESPTSKSLATNKYIANFISSRNYAASAVNSCHASDFHMDSYQGSGFLTSNRANWGNYTTSTSNVFVDPLGGANNTNNYYNFECLDAALNVKARVRLAVRDWDREFSPEDEEVERINPNAPKLARSSAGANVNINVANASANATTSTNVVDPTLSPGSFLFLDVNGNDTLEPAIDTRYQVDNKSGLSLLLTGAVADATAAYNFFVNDSKFDDTSSACFGSLCDVRRDFDGEWGAVNGPSPASTNTGNPLYGSCGDTSVNVVASGLTISFNPDSLSATLSAATTDPEIVAGTVLRIDNGDGGNILLLVRRNNRNGTLVLANTPGFEASGVSFEIVRKIPFPLEGHE